MPSRPRPDPPRTPDDPPEADIVEESGVASFPASDPPSWTGAIPSDVRPPAKRNPTGSSTPVNMDTQTY